jgi:hypothetical protein
MLDEVPQTPREVAPKSSQRIEPSEIGPHQPDVERLQVFARGPIQPIDPDPVELERRLRALDAGASEITPSEPEKKTLLSLGGPGKESRTEIRARRRSKKNESPGRQGARRRG